MDELRKTNYKHQAAIEAPEAEVLKVSSVHAFEEEDKASDDLQA